MTSEPEQVSRYVAFLRGLNVGGHRVKMDRLRALFSEMDFESVATFIASGNVLFTAPSKDAVATAGRIEAHLAEQLGYEVATFLRTPRQVRSIADFEPPSGHGAESGSCHVMLLKEPARPELRRALEGLTSDHDTFVFDGTEVYWCTAGTMSESPLFGGGLERVMRGVVNTARNLNTLRRLAARADLDG